MHTVPTLVIPSAPKVQKLCDTWRSEHQTIGFVPTMGCLHEGHLSLIRAARKACDRVVVSIFVNPLQFGKNEDFGSYPRPLERDIGLCKELGVDLVFSPDAADLYSPHFATTVSAGPLGQLYCGKSRPGFFDGVLTVVTILLNIVRPHKAFFGEKDYQQLFLIKQLVNDLRLQTEIIGMPILREVNGLAMSSRNGYLKAEQMLVALSLSKSIRAARMAYAQGDKDSTSLLKIAESVLTATPGFTLDYIHVVDEKSLQIITGQIMTPARLLLAGYVGDNPRVRLIDNDRL